MIELSNTGKSNGEVNEAMSIVIDGNRMEPFQSPHSRGRRRKYDEVALVQGIADGLSIAQAGQTMGIPFATINPILMRMRAEHRVKTTSQLVAHFLRNKWID